MSGTVQLAPGSLFADDYRIVKRLGGGGMGDLYVAEQQSTRTPRALKLMHPRLIQSPKARSRFEREARIGSRIESDHVVQVIGAGVDAASETPWLAMELLEGEDLSEAMKRQGPPPATEMVEVLRQLCHALASAHRLGIVHRDLKPENIFLSVSRSFGAPFTVKVLDFGIAKVAAQAQATATDALGTPLWMAPEQTEPGHRIAPATDVWALGLLTFWLLTGRYYWKSASSENTSVAALLREVLFEPMVSASERATELSVGSAIPSAFDAWFARCVAREPGDRFTDAGAALDGLLPVLTEAPKTAHHDAPVAQPGLIGQTTGAAVSYRVERPPEPPPRTLRDPSTTNLVSAPAPAPAPTDQWGPPPRADYASGAAAHTTYAEHQQNPRRSRLLWFAILGVVGLLATVIAVTSAAGMSAYLSSGAESPPPPLPVVDTATPTALQSPPPPPPTTKADPTPKTRKTTTQLRPVPAKTPKPPTAARAVKKGVGRVSINSAPASNVIFDGRAVGTVPRTIENVALGSHTVVFVSSAHGRKVRTVNVTGPGTVGVFVRFP